MSADLTTPTAPEPERRAGLMTQEEYWLCEWTDGVDGRAIVLDIIHQAATEAASAVSVAPQHAAPTSAPTLTDICTTFDGLMAEQRELKRLLGPVIARPTPYTAAEQRPKFRQPRRMPLPRDPVAAVGWAMAVIVVFWAVVITSLTIWMY